MTNVFIFNYWEETGQNVEVALSDEDIDRFYSFFIFAHISKGFLNLMNAVKNSTGIIKVLATTTD